jgi:hypothetical protein
MERGIIIMGGGDQKTVIVVYESNKQLAREMVKTE